METTRMMGGFLFSFFAAPPNGSIAGAAFLGLLALGFPQQPLFPRERKNFKKIEKRGCFFLLTVVLLSSRRERRQK